MRRQRASDVRPWIIEPLKNAATADRQSRANATDPTFAISKVTRGGTSFDALLIARIIADVSTARRHFIGAMRRRPTTTPAVQR
jgi:hypothetical protein